jgi:hypothetical protein
VLLVAHTEAGYPTEPQTLSLKRSTSSGGRLNLLLPGGPSTEGTEDVKQYDTTNRGEFYREENKKNEDGPDYTGSLDVNGVPHRLAGWIKTSKKTGKKFLSLAIEPKNGAKQAGAQQTKTKDDFNDDFQI